MNGQAAVADASKAAQRGADRGAAPGRGDGGCGSPMLRSPRQARRRRQAEFSWRDISFRGGIVAYLHVCLHLSARDGRRFDDRQKLWDKAISSETPLQGVFYDGQLWDARALVLKLIQSAKRLLILIDNWATAETLDFFAKKRKGVTVTIITSEHFKKGVPKHLISPTDIATFNAQYPKLAVRYNETFHDRFLIIDDKELYLIGASLKDLGKKCFAFTKLDAGEIRRIKKSAFGGGLENRRDDIICAW